MLVRLSFLGSFSYLLQCVFGEDFRLPRLRANNEVAVGSTTIEVASHSI